MKPVFVDTGAFFGKVSVDDQNHEQATAVFQRATDERWKLVTTNTIVAETHALLVNRARGGRAAGIQFLDLIHAGFCEVVRVTPDDERLAEAIVRRHTDQSFSLCDAQSFVVIARRKIKSAIAFDQHFRGYGKFQVVP